MSDLPADEKPGWAEWSKIFRDSIDEEVEFTDNNEANFCRLGPIISHHLHFATRDYATSQCSLTNIELRLSDVWYACIMAGKHIWGRTSEPNTVVVALAALKASGPLQRPSQRDGPSQTLSTHDADQPITFSDGRTFWPELPLFAVTLIDEFVQRLHQPNYGAEFSFNLATFVGRLVSVGIFDGPAICILSLFREALETPQPLTTTVNSDDVTRMQSFEDRLQTLAQTIECANIGLALLASNGSTTDKVDYASFPQLSSLGELAILRAGDSGFSDLKS
ncbi:unnamed protein product [Clonostachys solani]|uniref:Uncharacterized protein n=1 Tax=Clonostachys solani TaxID=160281 RepID=A0A9P0EKS5_9HYPO|nr:unnamed protein product [Clonostachys solani]